MFKATTILFSYRMPSTVANSFSFLYKCKETKFENETTATTTKFGVCLPKQFSCLISSIFSRPLPFHLETILEMLSIFLAFLSDIPSVSSELLLCYREKCYYIAFDCLALWPLWWNSNISRRRNLWISIKSGILCGRGCGLLMKRTDGLKRGRGGGQDGSDGFRGKM